MQRVKLKDVVMRVKDKIDKDNTDLEFYVGGEHIDSGELSITKKGRIEGSTIGPAFHMHFMPGDVLLMSRNPHLKKAGVVDFEGICSDVSYICRTKDESVLLQRYLPFVFQTDHFWAFVEENKKGGLPFFLNWSDFEKYEFDLPEIERQQELADMLWAAQETKLAYLELLKQSDELVKSQFVEELTPYILSDDTLTIEEMVRSDRPVTYGIVKPGTNVDGGVPVVRVKDFTDGVIHTDDMLHTSPDINAKYLRSTLLEGDVLLSIGGTVGRVAIVPKALIGANITQHTARLSMKSIYDPVYIKGVLESPIMQQIMQKNILGVAQIGLNLKDIRKFKTPNAPIAVMNRLADLYRQIDKSKLELNKAIKDIEELMKSIMQEG